MLNGEMAYLGDMCGERSVVIASISFACFVKKGTITFFHFRYNDLQLPVASIMNTGR